MVHFDGSEMGALGGALQSWLRLAPGGVLFSGEVCLAVHFRAGYAWRWLAYFSAARWACLAAHFSAARWARYASHFFGGEERTLGSAL